MNDGDAVTATASPANGPITEMPTDEQCRCPKCRKVSVQAAAGPNQWRRYCPVCDGHFRAGDTVLVPRKKTLGSIAAEFPPTIPALQEAAGHRESAEVTAAAEPSLAPALCSGTHYPGDFDPRENQPLEVPLIMGAHLPAEVNFDPAQKISLADFTSPGLGVGAVDPCSTKPVPPMCGYPGCESPAICFGTGAMNGEYRCGPHYRQLSAEFRDLMEAISDEYLRKLGAEVDATFAIETPAEEDARLLTEQAAKNAAAGSAVQGVHPADATVKRLETQLAMSQKGRRVAEEELTQARAKLAAIDKVLFHSPLSYEPDRAEAIGKIIELHKQRMEELKELLRKAVDEIDRRDMATVPPIRVRHEARAERLGLAQNIFTTVIMLHPLDDPEANATRAVQYADLLLSALAKKGGE